MAKPNYSFEKRQRELAKKKKKEEKLAKKASGGPEDMNPNEAALALGGDATDAPDADGEAEGDAPAGATPPAA